MKDKNHFRDIAMFYNNLQNVVLPVMQTDHISDETKQQFVSQLLPDMQERVQGTRDIIHKYIAASEEEFGLPFDLSEDPQELEG